MLGFIDIINYHDLEISFLIAALIIEVYFLYKIMLRRGPGLLANFIIWIDKFNIKRNIGKASRGGDKDELKIALIKNTLSKLSSSDVEKQCIALTEIKYFTRNMSKKDKELIADYLIDIYKTEKNTELKGPIIRMVCRLLSERKNQEA